MRKVRAWAATWATRERREKKEKLGRAKITGLKTFSFFFSQNQTNKFKFKFKLKDLNSKLNHKQ